MRIYLLLLSCCLYWGCQHPSVLFSARVDACTTPPTTFFDRLEEGPCYSVGLTKDDSIHAWMSASGSLIAFMTREDFVGTSIEEQYLPLYFTPVKDQQLQYIGAGPPFPSSPSFVAADYKTALNSSETDFPHQRFLFTLLAQALQGDTTAHRLFLQYPSDFKLVLKDAKLLHSYQHWKDRLQQLAPIATTSISRPTTWTLQSVGSIDELVFRPLDRVQASGDISDSTRVFLYQNTACIAVADLVGPTLTIETELPIYESLGTDVELSNSVPIKMIWQSKDKTYVPSSTQVTSARLIQDCSILAPTYNHLLKAEQAFVQGHELPHPAHQQQLQLFLSELLITTLEHPSCSLFDAFQTDFAHSIRYHTSLYTYLNLIQPIVQLNQPSTTITFMTDTH